MIEPNEGVRIALISGSVRTGNYTRMAVDIVAGALAKQPRVEVEIVDPSTLEDVAPGEVGILVHYDLSNTGSVLAVQTSDLGQWVGDGFEVVGRAPSAEARGCSLAADLLLGER